MISHNKKPGAGAVLGQRIQQFKCIITDPGTFQLSSLLMPAGHLYLSSLQVATVPKGQRVSLFHGPILKRKKNLPRVSRADCPSCFIGQVWIIVTFKSIIGKRSLDQSRLTAWGLQEDQVPLKRKALLRLCPVNGKGQQWMSTRTPTTCTSIFEVIQIWV